MPGIAQGAFDVDCHQELVDPSAGGEVGQLIGALQGLHNVHVD